MIYASLNSGAYVVIDSFSQISSADTSIVHSVSNSSIAYCYKVSAIDYCKFNESKRLNSFCNLIQYARVERCKAQIDYEVWRAEEGQAYSTLTSTNATSYSDQNVANYKKYNYKLLAISSGISPDSAWSNVSQNEIFTPDSSNIISAPVTESDLTNGEVEITWNGVTTAPF